MLKKIVGHAPQALLTMKHDGQLSAYFRKARFQLDQVPVGHALFYSVAGEAGKTLACRNEALDRFVAPQFKRNAHLV